MAITGTPETITLTPEERTWRFELNYERGQDPMFSVYRETVKVDDSGAVISQTRSGFGTISRPLSAVADDVVSADGITVTMTQLVALIGVVGDQWSVEEQAKRKAEADRQKAMADAQKAMADVQQPK